MTTHETASGGIDEVLRAGGAARPLRVVRGPDGRPRVVRRGLRALAALQAKVPRVLRVGVIRDGRIVEERILRRREAITVGASERNHFVVADAGLPGRHPLFDYRTTADGERCVLTIADGMTGRIAFADPGSGVMDLDEVRASGRAVPGRRGAEVKLDDGCRGKIVLGDTTLLFQFVVPPPAQPIPQLPASVRGGWLARFDSGFATSLGVAMAAHLALLCGTMIPDWPKPSVDELIASDYMPLQVVPASIEDALPAAIEEGDAVKRAAGDETVQPKPAGAEAANGAGGTDVVAVDAPKPPSGDATIARRPSGRRPASGGPEVLGFGDEQGAKVEQALGLQDLLGGPGGIGPVSSTGSIFDGTGSPVAGLGDALRNLRHTDDTPGAAGSWSSVGEHIAAPVVAAVGQDGPGTADPAVVPVRAPAVDAPVGTIDAGPVGTVHRPPPIADPRNEGTMSFAVFRQALERKMGSIRMCYNHALIGDPTLAGGAAFNLVVNLQGGVRVSIHQADSGLSVAGVTSCIQQRLGTLNFASSPPQGGEFRVRVPFDFVAP